MPLVWFKLRSYKYIVFYNEAQAEGWFQYELIDIQKWWGGIPGHGVGVAIWQATHGRSFWRETHFSEIFHFIRVPNISRGK